MQKPNSVRSKHLIANGFALVATLSLMILLTLVAVGLLGLSAVSLRSSSQAMAQSEARANARLALMLAIGELQKTMGPDQRISARAATLAKHPKLSAEVGPNTGKAWWVGASHSDPEQTIGGQPVVWLVSGVDSASQISQSLSDPEPLYTKNSIDTAELTGGQSIEAGKVGIQNQQGKREGRFAYIVDDQGMKAQLAPTNPKVRNDLAKPNGGGVLPGTYNLGILDKMGALDDKPWEDYNRLLSLNDLPLIGADREITRAKKLGYTTRSMGVLSDVRKGGLKKDLTIAFERDNVFNAVFSKGSGFGEKYIVMDSEKFNQSSDLKKNGYIHWEMFKDFYNIKKYIKKQGSLEYLDPILFNKAGILRATNTAFGKGQMGPHEIGNNSSVPDQHKQMPYANYPVAVTDPNKGSKNSENYKHSPVIPVMQSMQMNGWVEKLRRSNKDWLKTHVQLWVSHYNPYNIPIRLVGDAPNAGPRVITYPHVRFTIPGVSVKNDKGQIIPFKQITGLGGKRESHVPHEVVLGAGRGHVCAFKNDGVIGAENDRGLYDDIVQNLVLQSVYKEYEVSGQVPASVSLDVDFYLDYPSVNHGADHLGGNYEISQAFWAPFAWDQVMIGNASKPGRTIKQTVGSGQLNENSMASFALRLRTTREGVGATRPLVDSNIRAMLNNTKWDSPIGAELLAAYSPENKCETDEPIPGMKTDGGKGYAFWGAGRDALDGYDRVILFDIPREDLVSLGQLQHASAGRFSYEPTYIVGNSHANLRIPANNWRASVNDTFSTVARGLKDYVIPGKFNLYDASYLVNEELWDSYIFTTIPQMADNYLKLVPDLQPTDSNFQALLRGDLLLPNPRFMPYEPPGSKFNVSTLQMTTPASSTKGGFYHNAGHLLVDGSFNVNSTSVDAWEAFLSGTNGLPYQKVDANGKITGFVNMNGSDGVRFPRVKSVFGEDMETDSMDENYWTGFRSLKPAEVRDLAKEIVAEIKKRGPFLTLGEFVNRKLESGELGQRGALQAALDATVNKDLDSGYEDDASYSGIPQNSTQGAGFPGQLLQGDVLQALSPYMTVRSDTFTIRAYGESLAPGTNDIRARAWCEATVQRYPDPVPHTGASSDPLAELVNPSSSYGRSFRLISFRWLNANEV